MTYEVGGGDPLHDSIGVAILLQHIIDIMYAYLLYFYDLTAGGCQDLHGDVLESVRNGDHVARWLAAETRTNGVGGRLGQVR